MTGTQGEGHLTEITAHGWGSAHDRRRTHYLKALELLGNALAITRLGGVRVLVQLADEWLADASIPAPVGREQAQMIVDMLCAYVRLPFPLARNCPQVPASTPERSSDTGMARQHRIDEAEYLAEVQVRSRILAEIRGRVRQPQPLEDAAAGGEATPGPWSGFDFDFSGTEFFDTVDFSGCCWDGRLTFAGSTFYGAASFSNSVYRGQAGVSFEECTYRAGTCPEATAPVGADFSGSYYGGFVSFAGSTYEADACFSGSVYCAGADAQDCTYMADSMFSGCTHYGPVTRTGIYNGRVKAAGSTFYSSVSFGGEVAGCADFSGCAYYGPAYFRGTFRAEADFGGSIYCEGGHWDSCEFQGQALLGRSLFLGPASFAEAQFAAGSPVFEQSVLSVSPDAAGCGPTEEIPGGARLLTEEEAREVTPCARALIEAAAALPQPCVPHDHAAFEPVWNAEEQVRAWFDYFCCTDPPPRTGRNTLN
jgi:putative uncharacterized protein (fragment)